MAAKTNKVGRPSTCTAEVVKLAKSFVGSLGKDEVPDVSGLHLFLLENGVKATRAQLYDWAKINEEFSDTLTFIQVKNEKMLNEGGLNRKYSEHFCKFLLSAKHNYREKSDVTTDGKPMPQPILGGLSRQ
jgi:hypothetical protein